MIVDSYGAIGSTGSPASGSWTTRSFLGTSLSSDRSGEDEYPRWKVPPFEDREWRWPITWIGEDEGYFRVFPQVAETP